MKQEQESEIRTNYLFDTALTLPIVHAHSSDFSISSSRNHDKVIDICIMGHAVAYLVEGLCHKSEGRGFKSRNEYQELNNFLGSKAQPARKADYLTAMFEPIV
ncbi:hypothetical protein B7P43_G09055 [Cryptotermes secundus]|uniref:Uncharacterized protein n=1 Tax=Cryptotermes secundus TaxID=105785 RepID=A0A2J7PHP5_9NEOP|nr:hypothetical protein B7P43_G09055 [Cryptotermes secundus]